jgi:hypothetical protein
VPPFISLVVDPERSSCTVTRLVEGGRLVTEVETRLVNTVLD